jgi:hypothetical protein
MNYYLVNCFEKKGQIKIQQMAFVLVGLMIFFAIVALFYFSVSSENLKGDVEEIREEEVREMVRKMVGTPEFSWGIYDCSGCIDLDKVMMMKDRRSYEGFWKRIPYIQVIRVFPKKEADECTRGVYPDCNSITIVDENKENVIASSAFVALCRYDSVEKIDRCELGKIVMGFETVS